MFLRHLMSKCFSHKLAKYILKYIRLFKIGLTTMDPIFPCKSLSKIFSRNLKYSEFFSSIMTLYQLPELCAQGVGWTGPCEVVGGAAA